MLGSVCFRLFSRNGTHHPTKVILTQDHNVSFRGGYLKQLTSRSYVASPCLPRSSSCPSLHDIGTRESGSVSELGDAKRLFPHTSLCSEEGSEVTCATIWHGLLPSHHSSILDHNTFSMLKRGSFDAHHLGFLPWKRSSLPCKEQGLGRFAKGASLLDGSWNAAWDARPARWLHGRHSAWLLFGVRTSSSEDMGIPVASGGVKGISDPIITSLVPTNLDSFNAERLKLLNGKKQVYTDYTVIGIPSDGRCLFRAILHGACLRNREAAPSKSMQQQLADDLRSKVVDELISRRNESEWFIEDDFDAYIRRMREPYVWGGEPELLMASHVLKMPITVLFFDQTSKGLISIADYGSEYGSDNPIRILYHGFGHYDSVEIRTSV